MNESKFNSLTKIHNNSHVNKVNVKVVGFFDIWKSKHLILFRTVPTDKGDILEQHHKENWLFQSVIKYQM